MLINQVCKKCRLTKKAIEYYAAQKLVQPEILENGYRNFSAADIERLKKIAILRRLGLSVQSIKEVLDGGGQAALYKVSESKKIEIKAEETKQALVQQLAEKQMCIRDRYMYSRPLHPPGIHGRSARCWKSCLLYTSRCV